MKLASVVLDIPSRFLDREYFYEVPDSCNECQVGCAVLVSFGSRQAVGFVMELIEAQDGEQPDFSYAYSPSSYTTNERFEERSVSSFSLEKENDESKECLSESVQLGLFGEDKAVSSSSKRERKKQYKPILRVLTSSLFTSLGAQCARFLAFRYIAPLSSCVRLLTPPGGVPKVEFIEGEWVVTQPVIQEVDDRFVKLIKKASDITLRKNAAKQKMIVDALENGELRVSELRAEYGSVSSALKSLEEKGVIEIITKRRYRGLDGVPEELPTSAKAIKPQLTSNQKEAYSILQQLSQKKRGLVAVLDGVTGSGKTEVYLRIIEDQLNKGNTALVLVPEISLTPQTVARFRGRFGDTVAVLHSRMSQGERFDQWDLIRKGVARVVVGARSALFAPVSCLGVIIIDEEHEGSYKQDAAPRYVSRDVAVWLAEKTGALLILGSATPSLEALHNCETNDNWFKIEMPQRVNGRPLPAIEIVDMGREFGGGNKHMFSRRLQAELRQTLERKEKAVLLLNQRGFAQFVLCRECGFVPECPSCSTSLTYHEVGQKLSCHHCGYEIRVPNRCPHCQSPYLKRFGAGTQRVEAELRALFDDLDCGIIRMDSDTTKTKGAHQRLLEEFANCETGILLGTQMIAKGLDFDDVTLVGVINADTVLKLPDFRAPERTFDLIEQVAGRSGRSDLEGKVIVQTYNASHYSIQAAAHYRRDYFLNHDLALRKELGYPPYVRLINILLSGKDEKALQAEGMKLFQDLNKLFNTGESSSVQVYPPTACVLSRVKKVYRYHILLKTSYDKEIESVLNRYFRKQKARSEITIAIDVDPMSLL